MARLGLKSLNELGELPTCAAPVEDSPVFPTIDWKPFGDENGSSIRGHAQKSRQCYD